MANFPRGQLNADDEGELQLKVGVQDKTVIIDFGKDVTWIGLSADDARNLATLLIKRASQIDGAVFTLTLGS